MCAGRTYFVVSAPVVDLAVDHPQWPLGTRQESKRSPRIHSESTNLQASARHSRQRPAPTNKQVRGRFRASALVNAFCPSEFDAFAQITTKPQVSGGGRSVESTRNPHSCR